jgi:translocation and assembly module TamB
LPKDFAWQGKLNADVQLDLPASGPNGVVSLDASGGTCACAKGPVAGLSVPDPEAHQQTHPKRIDTDLNFVGGKLGELMVQAQINPLPKNKPLSGSFRLSGLDLSVARPFVPMVEKLTGRLNGSGTISGGCWRRRSMATVAQRRRSFRAGAANGDRGLQLQAVIAGETVQLNGGWKSGKTGQGSLNGSVAWGQALVVDLALKGTQLPVTVEPYAKLEVAPDLKISIKDDKLAVCRQGAGAQGEITIRELPPSTVKVSGDTVIVGQQTEQGKPPMAMLMDIDVVVGEDKLSFAGFGLTANLQGHVHIGDNMDTGANSGSTTAVIAPTVSG